MVTSETKDRPPETWYPQTPRAASLVYLQRVPPAWVEAEVFLVALV